jgi:hypothetical protein
MSKSKKINFPGLGLQTPPPESSIEFEDLCVQEGEEVDVSEEVSNEVIQKVNQIIDDNDYGVPENLKDKVLRDYRGRPIKVDGKFVISSIPLSILFSTRIPEDDD